MERLREIAELALREAGELGCETAQVTVADQETKEFNADAGEFTLMRTLFDASFAVTVFKDKRQGAVAVNSLSEEAVRGAVRDAVEAAGSAEPDDAWQIESEARELTITDGVTECDAEKLFFRSQELLTEIGENYPNLLVDQMITEHVRTKSLYLNTNGTCYRREAGQYGYYVGYSAHEGESSSHSYGSECALGDLDRPFSESGLTRRELADTARQACPVPFEGKYTGTVVFTPGCFADVVLGTIGDQYVSDVSLINGTSIWKDKVGQAVMDPRLTIRFAPGDPRIVCGQRYTSEGYLSEDFDLVKDGILQGFHLTQYGANKTGGKRSGNTSQSVVVPAGEETLDTIIAGIERGIWIGRFSGGQPGANGEFSGVAKNAFLIEDGKIGPAIAETMISANLNDMLFRLRGLSKEMLCDGKIAVPYAVFDGITISGK